MLKSEHSYVQMVERIFLSEYTRMRDKKRIKYTVLWDHLFLRQEGTDKNYTGVNDLHLRIKLKNTFFNLAIFYVIIFLPLTTNSVLDSVTFCSVVPTCIQYSIM